MKKEEHSPLRIYLRLAASIWEKAEDEINPCLACVYDPRSCVHAKGERPENISGCEIDFRENRHATPELEAEALRKVRGQCQAAK